MVGTEFKFELVIKPTTSIIHDAIARKRLGDQLAVTLQYELTHSYNYQNTDISVKYVEIQDDV